MALRALLHCNCVINYCVACWVKISMMLHTYIKWGFALGIELVRTKYCFTHTHRHTHTHTHIIKRFVSSAVLFSETHCVRIYAGKKHSLEMSEVNISWISPFTVNTGLGRDRLVKPGYLTIASNRTTLIAAADRHTQREHPSTQLPQQVSDPLKATLDIKATA